MSPPDLSAPRLVRLLLWVGGPLAVWTTLRGVLLDDRPPIDLQVFLRAARVVAAGLSPYRGDPELGAYYVYPQAWAWMMRPLAALPDDTAAAIWMVLSGVCLLLAIWWPARWAMQAPVEGGGVAAPLSPALLLAALFAAGLAWSPAHYGWRLGQAELPLAALLAGIFALPDRWRPVGAGLLLGLGIILKFSPVLLAPALVLAFGWRFLAAAAGVVVVYTLWLAGMGLLGEEIHLLTDQVKAHQFRAGYPSTAIYHLLFVHWGAEWFLRPDGFYDGPHTTALMAVLLAGYAVTGLWLWWRRASWLALLSVAVAWAHLASPFLEAHHHTLSLVVYTAWMARLARAGREGGLLLAMGGWLLAALFLGFAELATSRMPGHALLLGDVILIVLALRHDGINAPSPWLAWRGMFPPPRPQEPTP